MWSHRSMSSGVRSRAGGRAFDLPGGQALGDGFGIQLAVDPCHDRGQALLDGDGLDHVSHPVDPGVGAARAGRPDDDRDTSGGGLDEHEAQVGGDGLGWHLGHGTAEIRGS